MTLERLLDTRYGEARVVTHSADTVPEGAPELLLSHGAGGGIEARDLTALAGALPAAGYTVHLLEQPWRRAGRRIATAPHTLDVSLVAAVEMLKPSGPLILGGRSAGARSACRSASNAGAQAVLALSFPLHPPGRPEHTRWDELADIEQPTLVVQGERDQMGRPEEFPDPLPDLVDMVVVPAADHGLKVPGRAGMTGPEVMAIVSEGVMEWLVRAGLGG